MGLRAVVFVSSVFSVQVIQFGAMASVLQSFSRIKEVTEKSLGYQDLNWSGSSPGCDDRTKREYVIRVNAYENGTLAKGRPGCWEPASPQEQAEMSKTLMQTSSENGIMGSNATLVGDTCQIVLLTQHQVYHDNGEGKPRTLKSPALRFHTNGAFDDPSQTYFVDRIETGLSSGFETDRSKDWLFAVLERPVPGCNPAKLTAMTPAQLAARANKKNSPLKTYSHVMRLEPDDNQIWTSKCAGPDGVTHLVPLAKHHKGAGIEQEFATSRDSYNGDSGKPYFLTDKGELELVGVHTSAQGKGGTFDPKKRFNAGIVISPQMISVLQQLEAELNQKAAAL